jgi:hypothetical protein
MTTRFTCGSLNTSSAPETQDSKPNCLPTFKADTPDALATETKRAPAALKCGSSTPEA